MAETYHGRPCKNCGRTERYRSNNTCIACQKTWAQNNPESRQESNRKWRENNRDKQRECNRRWQRRNPESQRAKSKRYYQRHADKVRAYSRQRYRENRGKILAACRKRRQINPDKEYAAARIWRQANPDKIAAIRHRRRARLKGNGGSYTAGEWNALCKQYNHKCLACGKKRPLTVDHVIPIVNGGSNDISNIQPLCKSCNSSKGDKYIDYRTKPGIKRWIQRKLF